MTHSSYNSGPLGSSSLNDFKALMKLVGQLKAGSLAQKKAETSLLIVGQIVGVIPSLEYRSEDQDEALQTAMCDFVVACRQGKLKNINDAYEIFKFQN
jgi:hypothetical protein